MFYKASLCILNEDIENLEIVLAETKYVLWGDLDKLTITIANVLCSEVNEDIEDLHTNTCTSQQKNSQCKHTQHICNK